MTEDMRYSKRLEQRWDEQIGMLAGNLRDLADEVERDGKLRDPNNYYTIPMLAAVTRVQRTVLWNVANLNLDYLVTLATDWVEANATESEESRNE